MLQGIHGKFFVEPQQLQSSTLALLTVGRGGWISMCLEVSSMILLYLHCTRASRKRNFSEDGR